MQNIEQYVRERATAAKSAFYQLAAAGTEQKNRALLRMAELIEAHQNEILAANQTDMQAATAKGLDSALLDRLKLNENTVAAMCEGLRQVAALPDPVGEMDEFRSRPNG